MFFVLFRTIFCYSRFVWKFDKECKMEDLKSFLDDYWKIIERENFFNFFNF